MNESVEKNELRTAFEQRAAQLLRDSATSLDGQTRSQLNRARQAALDELPAAPRPGSSGYGWAIAGVAAVAVLTAVLLSNRPTVRSPVPLAEVPTAAVDLDLLMAEEELEMLEDLEFFAWLESEDFAGTDGAAG
jgi:hypothetical protein